MISSWNSSDSLGSDKWTFLILVSEFLWNFVGIVVKAETVEMCAAVVHGASVASVATPLTLVAEVKPTRVDRPLTPLHRLTLSRLMTGFFWTADTSVYGSRWRLGLFGKNIDMFGGLLCFSFSIFYNHSRRSSLFDSHRLIRSCQVQVQVRSGLRLCDFLPTIKWTC